MNKTLPQKEWEKATKKQALTEHSVLSDVGDRRTVNNPAYKRWFDDIVKSRMT